MLRAILREKDDGGEAGGEAGGEDGSEDDDEDNEDDDEELESGELESGVPFVSRVSIKSGG